MRGSTPAPGREFVRVGGHTSCILIWPGDDDSPSLILDAGTGIRSVSSQLDGAPFRGTILLTHLHWDHVQGLPFFAAGDRDDAEVHLLLPAQGEPAETLLKRAMSPPHFPIGPEGLRGRWIFETIDEGTHDIEGCSVAVREVRHKGGRTFGYRIQTSDAVIAYLPDHNAAGDDRERGAALELARDVDLLIHDAQFVDGEEHIADQFGHSTVEQAVELATEAGAREVALFHHSPARSDEAIEQIERTWSASADLPLVSVAVEGIERRIDRGAH